MPDRKWMNPLKKKKYLQEFEAKSCTEKCIWQKVPSINKVNTLLKYTFFVFGHKTAYLKDNFQCFENTSKDDHSVTFNLLMWINKGILLLPLHFPDINTALVVFMYALLYKKTLVFANWINSAHAMQEHLITATSWNQTSCINLLQTLTHKRRWSRLLIYSHRCVGAPVW